MASRVAPDPGLAGRGLAGRETAGRDTAGTPGEDTSGRKNMLLLVQLRWIAVVGQILTIAIVQVGFGLSLPLLPMGAVLLALLALNLASLLWLRRPDRIMGTGLFVALLCDVGALTLQLYLSGGPTNPFTSLYLLQITLGAVLLDARAGRWLVAATGGAVLALTFAYRPLVLPPGTSRDLFDLYIPGMLVGLALNATLTVVFVTRISRNLRERDARLAAMRQHAAEEDHIVRMGLLASGAAHELGTPLASLSVILGDWRRIPELAANRDLCEDIEHMQAEVGRCKAIVTGILLAAGAARGEAPQVTSVRAFVNDLVREWRTLRSSTALHLDDAFGADMAIVSDTALRQVVFNVLDNGFEVSPGRVDLAVGREDDALVLRISDHGPGFAPEMLPRLGNPYESSKGRLGGGLGLFLVVNVVRKLGGSVAATNRPEGGATVTLSLPLAALAIEPTPAGRGGRA